MNGAGFGQLFLACNHRSVYALFLLQKIPVRHVQRENQLTISLYDNKDKFPFTDGFFFTNPRGDFNTRSIEKLTFFRLIDICRKKDYLSNSKTFDECVHLRILLEHPTPELITVLNVCREKGVPRVTLCYSNPKSYGFILQEVAM